MKQLLSVTIILFLTTISAHANWQLVTETSEKGVTPFGVKTILNNFEYDSLFDWERKNMANSILAGQMVNPIVELEVTKSEHHWVGETKCEPGDPRLYNIFYGYTICYQNGDSELGALCLGTKFAPSNVDPCEYGMGQPIPLKMKRTALPNISSVK